MPNLERNLPIHYAALNGAAETLKFLLESYEVDVLSQNSFGRSTLTEAFTSKVFMIVVWFFNTCNLFNFLF